MILYVSFLLDLIKFYIQLIYYNAVEVWKLLRPPKPKSVKHEVVLVTGGANGIGKEILLYLAGLEKDLVLISWDMDTMANEAVVKQLRELGVTKALAYTVDVGDPTKVAIAAAKVRKDAGTVTMLFNNAGIAGPLGKCWEMDISQVKKTTEVNLLSSFITVQEFLPAMLQANKGHIIFTCSLAGILWGHSAAPYVSTKHAMRAFSYVLREDLRRQSPQSNIAVSTIYPNYIKTKMTTHINTYPRKYRFICPDVSAPLAVAQMVEAVLRNQEDIYIPSSARWSTLFFSVMPLEACKRIVDLVDIDPTDTKAD